MNWPSSEIISVVYYLLPGFVSAWVFYGLTAHQKASPFERVVQALIFTVFVQSFVTIVSWILLGLGRLVPLGVWSQGCALVWSVMIALACGLAFAGLANTDRVHTLLRRWT